MMPVFWNGWPSVLNPPLLFFFASGILSHKYLSFVIVCHYSLSCECILRASFIYLLIDLLHDLHLHRQTRGAAPNYRATVPLWCPTRYVTPFKQQNIILIISFACWIHPFIYLSLPNKYLSLTYYPIKATVLQDHSAKHIDSYMITCSQPKVSNFRCTVS